jgi:hypothetical protein
VTTAIYRTETRRASASANPTPLRDILLELVEDFADCLERNPGVDYLARSALRMHRAGAEGFAGSHPLAIVAELAELLPPEEPAS